MKYTVFFLIMISFSFALPIQQSRSEKKAEKEQAMRELIESRHYKFVATQALPMQGGSVNLTSDYDLVVDSLRITSFLPFFGVAYYAEFGETDGGIKFDHEAEYYDATYNKKKEMYHINMNVKGKKDTYHLTLDAGLSGYATLVISSMNKQTISYYGQIEPIH